MTIGRETRPQPILTASRPQGNRADRLVGINLPCPETPRPGLRSRGIRPIIEPVEMVER